MKRIIKVCALIFVVVLLFTMVGCKKKNPPKEPVIESIQVVEGSIPSQVYIDEVNSNGAINKFTDYRTYMDYDIRIINRNGETMTYSKVFKDLTSIANFTPFLSALISYPCPL